jgi:hypothetical protein
MKKLLTKISWIRVIYYLRIMSNILFMVLSILLLSNIINCGVEGIIFIVFYFLFTLQNIYTVLSKKKKFKENIYYNILNIGLFIYTFFIYSRIYLDKRLALGTIYELNLVYFKNNYLILSTIILGIIFNALILNNEE